MKHVFGKQESAVFSLGKYLYQANKLNIRKVYMDVVLVSVLLTLTKFYF